MSTQSYPSQPLFTPGVILGLVIFVLTCGALMVGNHYTNHLKTENEKRVHTINTKTTERNKLENSGAMHAYRLYTRNKDLLIKQKKFSNIPHFFQTLTAIQELNPNTVRMQGLNYSIPTLKTTVRVPVALTPVGTQRAVNNVYTFLNLFRDGFYESTLSYPLPTVETPESAEENSSQESADIELPIDPFIMNYGNPDHQTPAYFTLDFVPNISLETDSQSQQKFFRFEVDFRLKDIID